MSKEETLELDPVEQFKRDLENVFEDDDDTTDSSDNNEDVDEIEDPLEENEDQENDTTDEQSDEYLDSDEDESDSDEVKEVPKKTSNKDQAKIVALKRELKEAKEKLNAAVTQEKVQAETKQLDELVGKYTALGYDEDTSKHYAQTDFEMQEIKRELATAKFIAANADLLKVYPDAKNDTDKILNTMKLTGFTAKQVCRAMYDQETTNPKMERAKQAVSGKLERKESTNSVSSATRSASGEQKTQLTESQRIDKKKFERMFNLGDMSPKEYLELKSEYGF